MTKKNKKLNVLFFANPNGGLNLIFQLHQYTKNKYGAIYRPIYKRALNFFIFEWIFALQKNLPREMVKEISEYAFQRYVLKHNAGFFARLFFDVLGKMHFVKYYGTLKKHDVQHIFIYDDIAIANKACIVAAYTLKVDVTIFSEGCTNAMLLVDRSATRWNNSIPRNVDFFKILNPQRQYISDSPHPSGNMILVVMQEDSSPEILLHSPWISSQRQLLRIIVSVSQKLPNTHFVIFNTRQQYEDSANVHFSDKPLEEFLPFCKAVVTVNDHRTICAFEYHRPVILLGNTFFNIQDLSVSASSVETLHSAIVDIENFPFNKEVANNFLYAINTLYSVKCLNVNYPTNNELNAMIQVSSQGKY
ncbi:MAG: hypothetical protein ACI9CD_000136 [Candidatus Deianiraeaceae bacterium]|jgi:hypothetical protein